MADNVCVDCATCREALSARLDGEADDADLILIETHLPTCAQCRAWEHDTARMSRTIRVRPAAGTPDLTAKILSAAVPPPARDPWPVWRAVLSVVGLAQFTLGLAQLLGVGHIAHGADGGAHLFNESAAWNTALGIGFTVAAVWTRLAAGMLPTLAVFAGVLTVVSIGDVVNGQVDASRLQSHVLVLLGLAVLLVVHRQHQHENGPKERQRLIKEVRYSPMDTMPEPDHRTAPNGSERGMRPAGHHVA